MARVGFPQSNLIQFDGGSFTYANLARAEQVRRIRILDRELTIENGELTPTLKVRRRIVTESCENEIKGLYESNTDPEIMDLSAPQRGSN